MTSGLAGALCQSLSSHALPSFEHTAPSPPCPEPRHSTHLFQSSPSPQTPWWHLQNPHTLGSGSLSDLSSPILCHLPSSWLPTAPSLIQAPQATRGPVLCPARPVLPLSDLLCTSLPHQTHLPHPGAGGSPLPGSTQPVQANLCCFLPMFPCLQPERLHPPPLSIPCHTPTWNTPFTHKHNASFFLLSLSPNGLSPFTSLQAHSLLCATQLLAPSLSSSMAVRVPVWELSRSRFKSWLYHYITVESNCSFEVQYSVTCTFLRRLWGALHKHVPQVRWPKILLNLSSSYHSPPHKQAAQCSRLNSYETLSTAPGT